MTEPVILYGTQSNGETLPVQVDQTGRLVAEGLPGPEGPQGPQGEQGIQGPPGEGGGVTWPPGASNGDVLTWVNGEPQWRTPGIPSVLVWSDYLTCENGGFLSGREAPRAFDGNPETGAYCETNGALVFAPPAIDVYGIEVSFAEAADYPGYKYQLQCGDLIHTIPNPGYSTTWVNYYRLIGATISPESPLYIRMLRSDDSVANGNFGRIKVNAVELEDELTARDFYRESLKQTQRRRR